MALKECVYRVLLVSASEKFNHSLCALLPGASFSPVITVGSLGAARRALLERDFDLLLINAPLPDEFGTRLAMSAATDSDIGVLLFVKNELYEEISVKVMGCGVLTLAKPTSPQMILQSLRLLCASCERLRRIKKRNVTLEEKMEEIRLVNRAKWALISNYSMTEADAHRYVEKMSMDRCISKREAAEEILGEQT